MRYWFRLLVSIFLLIATKFALAQALGAVMMHGKWSSGIPWHIVVSNSIKDEGWPVIELTMPWSANRLYDASYDEALRQVAAAVAELRSKGVRRVVVGGHSFGANAAIAYAASGGDLDAILAMAPGHSPGSNYRKGTTKETVDQAKQLVAEGKGAEKISFVDTNQGKQRGLTARADVFLSYFDPNGLGDMPTSMAKIAKPIPLLWLIGTNDPLYPAGQAFAYNRAPAHPLSGYVVVAADHANTPSVGREEVIKWLKLIAAQPE